MKLTKDTKILIVGLGVIGGGYAKALTDAGYNVRCITEKESDVQYALSNGIISYGTTKLDANLIGDSDLIIFALYPKIFINWIEQNQSLIKSGALITDVSGVKGTVVEKVNQILRKDVEYVSTHPMAGREASGVEYSDPSVFKGANYIVIPTSNSTKEGIDVCKQIGQILGFTRITELSVEEHDRMIAFLSQLTHCIAVTLMTCNNEPNLEKYTGDSFRDLTRIAKINDKMWSELFDINKKELLKQMDLFSKEFERFRKCIEDGDLNAVRETMKKATARRTAFDKPKI